MAFYRVTGSFLDWSGPEDFDNGLYGCAFEIGGNFVPASFGPHNMGPHAVCYPSEGSALYLLNAQGPTKTRYVLRHFILDYPNGVVVGWYHDRIMDIPPSEMCMNDIEIFSKDTKINMSKPALYAKTPEGRFITGPVWIGAFNPHDRVHLGPQWNETPNSVVHGMGWYVPSWVFEPDKRRGLVCVHKAHALPSDISSPKSPCVGPEPEHQVIPTQRKYLAILPRPLSKSDEQKGAVEEAKEFWKKRSSDRLVHKEDQEDLQMPTYVDLSLKNIEKDLQEHVLNE
tara:strand:- start:47 stop:898 length:852 start_codon:yes stop_codon:yes gene_type:complete